MSLFETVEYLLFKKMEINSNPNESKAMNDGGRTYCEWNKTKA